MSAFDDIGTILLSIPGGRGSISDKYKDEQDTSWFKTDNIEKVVAILTAKHLTKECFSYPNCGSCDDAGCYRHTKLDFRIQSNLMLIGYKSCSYEGNVNSSIMEIIRIFADNIIDLIQIIKQLNFPRYALENIPEEIMPHLSQVLFCSSSLKVLELEAVNITLPTIKLLRNVLIGSTSLEQLHLVECYLPMDDESEYREDMECLLCLKQGIKASQSLKILRFEDCAMSDEGLMILVSSNNIENLTISGNRCNVTTLKTLGEILKGKEEKDDDDDNYNNNDNSHHCRCKMKYLNLSRQADPLDISPLVHGLGYNNSLIELNLQWNEFSDNGIQCLVERMKYNHTLKRICLQGCDDDEMDVQNCLTQHGLQSLGEGLSTSFHGLKFLDLSGNIVENNALTYLSNGLTDNTTLETLLCGNIKAIDETHILQLFTALPKSNVKMFEIVNASETMTPVVIDALLCGSKKLEVLFVTFGCYGTTLESNNNVSEVIMSTLCNRLPQLENLIDLHLYNFNPPINQYSLQQIVQGLTNKNYSPLNENNLNQLVTGIENNTSLKHLKLDQVIFDCTSEVVKTELNDIIVDKSRINEYNLYQKLMYYIRLNSYGRYLLHTSLTPSLWPYVLQKVNNDPTIIHFFLTREVLFGGTTKSK